MKTLLACTALLAATYASACDRCGNYDNTDFKITKVNVQHDARIGATIWEITVEGAAGKTVPTKAGQLKLVAGMLYGNTDVDAAAEFSIALTGITTLANTDFVL